MSSIHNPSSFEDELSLSLVNNEVPSGNINGVNATFTTTYSFVPGSIEAYLNGLKQRVGASNDYTESGTNAIIFNNPLEIGDTITVGYIKS